MSLPFDTHVTYVWSGSNVDSEHSLLKVLDFKALEFTEFTT
jgi:hypothetical protein